MSLDLVRAFAVASSSCANGQEYGKFVGAWIFNERIARPRLRGDAQPILPLGELRDLDNYLALGVTYDKRNLRRRGALLVLGEVDAYRWVITLDEQGAAEDDSRGVRGDMEILLVRGGIREALDHRAYGGHVGVHVDIFQGL